MFPAGIRFNCREKHHKVLQLICWKKIFIRSFKGEFCETDIFGTAAFAHGRPLIRAAVQICYGADRAGENQAPEGIGDQWEEAGAVQGVLAD